MRDWFEDLMIKEEFGSKEVIYERGDIFCCKCNELLMSSKDVKEFIQIARQQWVDEGYWDKYILHACNALTCCPECGTKHFLTFIVRQYVNRDGVKRYRYGTIGFQDNSKQMEFTNTFLYGFHH